MSLSAFAIAAALSAGGASEDPNCDGSTTPQINQCFEARFMAAEAQRVRYVKAAGRRIRKGFMDAVAGDPRATTAAPVFDAAELSWSKYRDQACAAVFDWWSTGTIRTVEALDCKITLTRRHTHDVWSQWLSYMDSTPSILPEPPND